MLPDVDIWMVLNDLKAAPRIELPPGYRLRFFREGEIPLWVNIQQAADPFFTATAEIFERSMPGTTAYRAERIMFLVDRHDVAIGTITAWNSKKFTGQDTGHIHWVAMVPAAQGRGLAKPMLSATLWELQKRGYSTAWLETNTGRIPALNLYLKFGFRPHLDDPTAADAWQAIEPHLKYR